MDLIARHRSLVWNCSSVITTPIWMGIYLLKACWPFWSFPSLYQESKYSILTSTKARNRTGGEELIQLNFHSMWTSTRDFSSLLKFQSSELGRETLRNAILPPPSGNSLGGDINWRGSLLRREDLGCSSDAAYFFPNLRSEGWRGAEVVAGAGGPDTVAPGTRTQGDVTKGIPCRMCCLLRHFAVFVV